MQYVLATAYLKGEEKKFTHGDVNLKILVFVKPGVTATALSCSLVDDIHRYKWVSDSNQDNALVGARVRLTYFLSFPTVSGLILTREKGASLICLVSS